MAETWIIIAVVVVAVVIVFGAANIITATGKISPAFQNIVEETNQRCDVCLSQFNSEGVNCNHASTGKVCTALMNYYCVANCSVQIR